MEFPMWVGTHKRLLAEVVAGVPDSTTWRLRWFDGVGAAFPLDEPMDVRLSQNDLKGLELVDLNEIVLLGKNGDIDFELSCEDSTRWVVSADPDDIEVVAGWFRTVPE